MKADKDIQVKIYQMTGRTGRPIANQYELYTQKGRYFQSYQTIIVFVDNKGQVYLDENKWDYSRTTSKYRNQFLGENTKETQKKIDKGIHILTDLNC